MLRLNESAISSRATYSPPRRHEEIVSGLRINHVCETTLREVRAGRFEFSFVDWEVDRKFTRGLRFYRELEPC